MLLVLANPQLALRQFKITADALKLLFKLNLVWCAGMTLGGFLARRRLCLGDETEQNEGLRTQHKWAHVQGQLALFNPSTRDHDPRALLLRPLNGQAHAPALLTGAEVLELQAEAEQVRVDEAIIDYILAVVERTRTHESLTLGVSPRGAQALYRAAQAMALLDGRTYATPDDVKRLAVPVLAHRVALSTRVAAAQRTATAAERIIEEILTLTEVPL